MPRTGLAKNWDKTMGLLESTGTRDTRLKTGLSRVNRDVWSPCAKVNVRFKSICATSLFSFTVAPQYTGTHRILEYIAVYLSIEQHRDQRSLGLIVPDGQHPGKC